MKAKQFPEVNLMIAESQDEYETLPAYFNRDDKSVTFCFELTEEEINRIYATGEIWFKQITFGQPMQPIALSTNKEELIPASFNIKVKKTDVLFNSSPDTGTKECVCSRCGNIIHGKAVRAWPEKNTNSEYRFHQKCIL